LGFAEKVLGDCSIGGTLTKNKKSVLKFVLNPTWTPTISPYRYQMVAHGPENGLLTYGLKTASGGMAILPKRGYANDAQTGLLTWNNLVLGNTKIDVTVTDAGGLVAVQGYTLTTRVNHVLVIGSVPKTQVTVGNTYRYDVQATDIDGDLLTYSLDADSVAQGMKIDRYGRITWQPQVGNVGTQAVVVTVDLIMAQPDLQDLAQRPVMGQLLVAALADLQRDLAAGKSIDLARVYYYAVRQKMETDIRSDRTFTSLADKTFFLCELAGAMYDQETLSLHFSEFPEQLRSMFGLEDRELDHWCYDMAGETLLIRDREGNYKFAHNSLQEFFVAYKFAAELGLLHRDFWDLVAGCGISGSTWSETRQGLHSNISPQEFQGFLAEQPERLVETFGRFPLRQSKVVTDLLLAMLDVPVGYQQINPLLDSLSYDGTKALNI
jgi:hypothetical protein